MASRPIPLIVVLLMLTSCDSSNQAAGPYDCVDGSIPADAQCFDFQDAQQAFRFKDINVVGSWSSADFETCITYSADGTGTFRYWGIVGSVPRDDSSVRWGEWVDVNGDPVLTTTGQPVIVHHLEDGTVLDRRLTGLGYTDSDGLGGDFERVDACPDYKESSQGVITFFTTNSKTDAISVGLDSFVIGELSQYIPGDDPPCGSATTKSILTVYRQPGSYHFQALSSASTWGPIDIEVKTGECANHALR
ncbi:MAG: hypothetical protein WBW88_13410 [Rhodothermales bacterium]